MKNNTFTINEDFILKIKFKNRIFKFDIKANYLDFYANFIIDNKKFEVNHFLKTKLNINTDNFIILNNI